MPYWSTAVIVGLIAPPAVGDDGVDTVNPLRLVPETANDPEVPLLPEGAVTDVTVRFVLPALNKVIEPVACPEALKLKLLLPAPHPPADG